MPLRRQDWRMSSPIRRLGREADLNSTSGTLGQIVITGTW